ncbi:hypothetical protein LWI29_028760 [Acer saccharum]|uniref:Uncharacterized protein n=1 Tax=Acer saccharum TaxID=4024 RepID=A0AA39RVL0_ACESA|nr:hypothetical protein LWI29_028760 [Acer saccharum]
MLKGECSTKNRSRGRVSFGPNEGGPEDKALSPSSDSSESKSEYEETHQVSNMGLKSITHKEFLGGAPREVNFSSSPSRDSRNTSPSQEEQIQKDQNNEDPGKTLASDLNSQNGLVGTSILPKTPNKRKSAKKCYSSKCHGMKMRNSKSVEDLIPEKEGGDPRSGIWR